MAIPYTCPHCGFQGKVAEKLAGQRVKCKNCAGIMRIPDGPFGGVEAVPFDAQPLDAQPIDAVPMDAPPYSPTPGYAPMDAGYAPVDPGYAPADAGYAPVDAGYAPVDAGFAPLDAGYAPVGGVDTSSDFAPAGGIEEALPIQPPGMAGPAELGADADELDADSLEDGGVDADDLSASDDHVDAALAAAAPATTDSGDLDADELDADDMAEDGAGEAAPAAGAMPGLKGAGSSAPPLAIKGSVVEPETLTAEQGGPGAASLPNPPALGENQRFCPKCGGVISTKTHLCRHCGFDLNFEHLLTGEKANVELGRPMALAATSAAPKSGPKYGLSIPRVLGAVALIAGFFLPWLTGLHDETPGAPPTYKYATPTALSGYELLLAVQNPTAKPPPPIPDEEEIGGADAPPITMTKVNDNVPKLLRPNAPASTRMLTLGAIFIVPFMGVVILLWELVRRNATVVLGALPLFGAIQTYLSMAVGFEMVGYGLFVCIVGAVLTFIGAKEIKDAAPARPAGHAPVGPPAGSPVGMPGGPAHRRSPLAGQGAAGGGMMGHHPPPTPAPARAPGGPIAIPMPGQSPAAPPAGAPAAPPAAAPPPGPLKIKPPIDLD